MSKVKSYLSLIKFSHTIFAMPFALIGFCLGLFSNRNHVNAEQFVFFENRTQISNGDVIWALYIRPFILVILCM
ncbi:MAG TPA: 4-hydroxybenzoate octaprenyltransferase, partial [Chitinophagaceae bacterium]